MRKSAPGPVLRSWRPLCRRFLRIVKRDWSGQANNVSLRMAEGTEATRSGFRSRVYEARKHTWLHTDTRIRARAKPQARPEERGARRASAEAKFSHAKIGGRSSHPDKGRRACAPPVLGVS